MVSFSDPNDLYNGELDGDVHTQARNACLCSAHREAMREHNCDEFGNLTGW
jgi:hypothetical protein